MKMTTPRSNQNRLLGDFPSKAVSNIRDECALVELRKGEVLYEPGEQLRAAYFPIQGMISLVAQADGKALEVALVGDEGMVGVPLLLGADSKPLRVLVQSSGNAWRIKAATLKRMTDDKRDLRQALNRYVVLRLAQVAQSAICANAHQLEARLVRRILMMQDRYHSNEISATHESLANMLGVQRTSVSIVAVTLQRKKLVQYSRGILTVLDQKGLEALSCGCYPTAAA
jgi:CRP-like cAMP-binding protein